MATVLLLPLDAEKELTAQALVEMGVGRVPQGKFTIEGVVRTVGEMLADPSLSIAAREQARLLAVRGTASCLPTIVAECLCLLEP